MLGCKGTSKKIQTWRRTPAPAKITVAGEKTCMLAINAQSQEDITLSLTRLTPLPRVAENASRTLIVGSSHFVSLSSLLRA